MPRYPLHHSWFWERAPLIKILLPLIIGILWFDKGFAGKLGAPAVLIISVTAGAAYAIAALQRQQHVLVSVLTFLSLQVFVAAMAILLCRQGDVQRNAAWFGWDTGSAKAYLARLSEPVQEKERTWKLRVSMLKSIDGGIIKPVTGDAFISLYKADGGSLPYATGDTLLLANAQWQIIKNAGNPFEYDYAKSCARKGIRYQCFAPEEDFTLYGKLRPQSLSLIDKLHSWSDRQLTRYIRDTATLGLLQAMILGDEHNFDPMIRQAYSDTGVIHIVSISGSHVAMLFLLITGLLFWLRGRHAGWIKYAIGTVIIWIYILMAGAPPSAVRSGLMFTVVALGVVFAREKQPLNTLFAAAIVLLAYEPMWLFSVGFQLSFGAVLSLTLFYAPLNSLWPAGKYLEWWATKWIPAGIAASLAAEILTAPLVIYYFHNLPLFVVFANLLAAILIGLCALVGGFGILVFSWLPPAANLLSALLVKVVHFFNAAMLLFQRWTFPSWKYLDLTFAELLTLYLIITGTGYALLERKSGAFRISLTSAAAFILLLCLDRYDALRQQHFVVFNTGRAATIELINGQHYSPLISADSGESYTTKSAHTGWHSWRRLPAADSEILLIHGSKILLLDKNISGLQPDFPVDVLVISAPLKGLSAAGILQTFHPKKIVVCGMQSRWYRAAFRDSCILAGLTVHDVSADGAFILE